MTEHTVNTIGEWTGKVRFHGIQPDFVHSDSPSEVYAFLTVEGGAANVSIPVIKGEKGDTGDYRPALDIRGAVDSEDELPQYAQGSNKNSAVWLRGTSNLYIWNGNVWSALFDALPQGPEGPPGESIVGPTGPTGPQGPEGPMGPAASISSSSDYSGTAQSGHLLMYREGAWRPTQTANVGGAISTDTVRVSSSSLSTVASVSLGSHPVDRSIVVVAPDFNSTLRRSGTMYLDAAYRLELVTGSTVHVLYEATDSFNTSGTSKTERLTWRANTDGWRSAQNGSATGGLRLPANTSCSLRVRGYRNTAGGADYYAIPALLIQYMTGAL